jgi:hypothetical protein
MDRLVQRQPTAANAPASVRLSWIIDSKDSICRRVLVKIVNFRWIYSRIRMRRGRASRPFFDGSAIVCAVAALIIIGHNHIPNVHCMAMRRILVTGGNKVRYGSIWAGTTVETFYLTHWPFIMLAGTFLAGHRQGHLPTSRDRV